jgi:hypothetical protein
MKVNLPPRPIEIFDDEFHHLDILGKKTASFHIYRRPTHIGHRSALLRQMS